MAPWKQAGLPISLGTPAPASPALTQPELTRHSVINGLHGSVFLKCLLLLPLGSVAWLLRSGPVTMQCHWETMPYYEPPAFWNLSTHQNPLQAYIGLYICFISSLGDMGVIQWPIEEFWSQVLLLGKSPGHHSASLPWAPYCPLKQ